MLKHTASLVMQVLKNTLVFDKCHDQSALSNLYDVIRKACGRPKQTDSESASSVVDTSAEV